MNTILKKSVLVALTISCGMSLVSCKNSVKTEKNNPVVQQLISENIDTPSEVDVIREPIVFITGYDKGDETFYTNARAYFKSQNYTIIEDKYSVEEIINYLNDNKNENSYGEIHIVNKSNPYKGMTLETLVKGDIVTSETLRRAIIKGELPILDESVYSNSKIILHANGLGNNNELMATFKDAFFAEELTNVVASPYYSIFDGEFSQHFLAEAFHVFYPTANSPGKVDLSKEIAKKYPNEKDINWYDALNNESERYIGEAYTSKFTIPVKFELDYHNSDEEMPNFESQEEVMDFIEQQEELYADLKALDIPLEKFRWRWSVKNSSLIIKGNTTGLTVLKPLIKPYGELEHIKPDTKNKRLYAMK